MNNQIQETVYILPLTFLYNGLVSAPVVNPQYLLLEDDLTAEFGPNGSADVVCGNFNFNIPVGAIVTGIQFTVRAKVGSINVPPATLTFNAVDDTSGTIIYHPYTASFSGMTQDLATYTFGSANYLFGTTWNVNQINNFKLQLIGSGGDIFVDDVQAQVFYYTPGTPTPPTPSTQFCLTCESPIQGVEYFLALDLTSTQTKAYVYDFNYADGTPIQIADLGDCGGVIEVVIDEGQVATNGSNFMENAALTNITRLPSGLVELDFGTLNNRGLMFKTPYAHDSNLVSPHSVNAKLIISNSAPYENKKLRTCQKGVVFSAPIVVESQGVQALPYLETLNFIGPTVQAEVDPSDPTQANVTILTQATNVNPTVGATSTGSAAAVTTLTISHTITTENYLRVWLSTDNVAITSVTFNGVGATLVASETNGPANLKVALYGLVNPTAGTHNIVITLASSSDISGGGVSFNSVDTTSPTIGVSGGAIGSSTAPSDTITTTVQNTVIQDVVGGVINTTAFVQGALWTIAGQVNAAARPGASSTRKVLVPTTVTDTYTIAPTGAWAIIIAGVRGIATPVGGVASVTGLNTDNTDPANPVVKISVDGASITGLGTPGSPLVAHTTGSGQAGIQFEDEGSALGSSGTADTVNFTGAGVTASRSGNTVTVNVPGGGSTVTLETNGTPNTDQALLNLIAGANVTLTPDAFGGVTIASIGGGGIGSGSGYNSGQTSRASGTGTGTQTIAHGLGVIPKLIKITAICNNSSLTGLIDVQSFGTATAVGSQSSTSNSLYSNTSTPQIVQDASNIINLPVNGGALYIANISALDATNITLNFTTVGGTGSCLIQWEAYAGGGSSPLTVNADENESTNFTTQINGPATGINGSSNNGWSAYGGIDTGIGPVGPNGFDFFAAGLANAIGGASAQIIAPSVSNLYVLSRDTPKTYRLKFYGRTRSAVGSATNRTAIGFSSVLGAGTFYSETSTAGFDVKFVFNQNGGTMYAVCSDSVAVTSVNLGIDPNGFHLFEIVVVPYTSAKFYVDGALVATITTHLYTTGTDQLYLKEEAFNFGNTTDITTLLQNPTFSLTL